MNRIKWFTQRTTQLIVWPMNVVIVPFLMATVVSILGLWKMIDALYITDQVWFWIALVGSRLLFAFGWFHFCDWIIETGKRNGFFWFKPPRRWRLDEVEPVDKSGDILSWVALLIIAFAFSKFAIRVSTLTIPPYMPPTP